MLSVEMEKEEWETCDAGKENGTIKCSSDCLYIGEVRSTNDNGLPIK